MRNENRGGSLRTLACLVLAIPLLLLPRAGLAEVTGSVDLEFWGRAIFNTHYDTALQAVDFMSYLTDDETEEWNFNPRDTRLGFSAGETDGDWTYRAVFEMDFYGDDAGNNLLPRMRLGFAEARNADGFSIRAGQDWIPICQQNPGTIDFGVLSWGGNLWWRVPQITVRGEGDSLHWLVGVMKHRISNSQEQQEKMPWLMGRVAFPGVFGERSLLALGGGFRSVTVDENDYSADVGCAEFRIPLGGGAMLNGEIYAGQGIGREFVHYDFDYNPDHPDGPTEIKSVGGFASLMVPAGEGMQLNFGAGVDDPEDDDLVGVDGSDLRYLKNTVFFANFKKSVTKHFGWGAEFAHFTTDDDGEEDDLTGQRFTSSIWFVF